MEYGITEFQDPTDTLASHKPVPIRGLVIIFGAY